MNSPHSSFFASRQGQWAWWTAFFLGAGLFLGLVWALFLVTQRGVGLLGVNNQVFWGWDIINFIFWIGIGHAGTLISAILLLTRQSWRCSIARVAEAMTLCAVICAGIFPVFHLGRVWMAWFFLPVPEPSGMWQNFLSPLMWDMFAVGTYFLLSLLFFYLCFIPDLAERARQTQKVVWARLSLFWQGSRAQKDNLRQFIYLMAGVLTALVISVHSVVSYDFAVTLVPSWNTSLFPPFFVAGAILGGLAMVLLVILVLKSFSTWGKYILESHLNALCKLMLAVSLVMGMFYFLESGWLFSWLLGDNFKALTSSASKAEWGLMVLANVGLVQLFWWKKCRLSPVILGLVGLGVTGGMWLERWIIVVRGMEAGQLASTWASYKPSFYDMLMFGGSFGLFVCLMLLLGRYFPLVNREECVECAESPQEKLEVKGEIKQDGDLGQEEEKGEKSPCSLGAWMFWGGLVGACGMGLLAYYTQIQDYPLVLQGREALGGRFMGFIPIFFEVTLLCASLSGLWAFLQNHFSFVEKEAASLALSEGE